MENERYEGEILEYNDCGESNEHDVAIAIVNSLALSKNYTEKEREKLINILEMYSIYTFEFKAMGKEN
jgi:hypothetical protein